LALVYDPNETFVVISYPDYAPGGLWEEILPLLIEFRTKPTDRKLMITIINKMNSKWINDPTMHAIAHWFNCPKEFEEPTKYERFYN